MSSAPPVDMALEDARPAPRPARTRPAPAVRGLLAVVNVVASLRLTVALFALSMVLVFAGTLAQMDAGILSVVDTYFWSWFVWVPAQVFVRFGQVFFDLNPAYVPPSWAGFPLPGGRLIGGVMLVNLLAAHVMRFRAGQTVREVQKGFAGGTRSGLLTTLNVIARRGGVWATHTGLVLLIVGEIGTRVGQVEQRMIIAEGETVGYTSDARRTELAFVDRRDPGKDSVVVVPEAALLAAHRTAGRVADPALPVDVQVNDWFTNSDLSDDASGDRATVGYGLAGSAVKLSDATGVDAEQKVDTPSAYVTLFEKGTDTVVGKFLVSTLLSNRPPQAVPGSPADVELRFARYYKPFTIKLLEFTVKLYPGTNKPQTYASRVLVVDPEDEGRETTISMNEPMLHRGESFFQAGLDPDPRRGPIPPGTRMTTILQVVRNPVKWLPYAACGVVSFGLVLHFGYYLIQFLGRMVRGTPAGGSPVRVAAAPVDVDRAPRPGLRTLAGVAVGVLVAGLLYYGGYVMRTTPVAVLDLKGFGALPVQDGGRVKPLDTLARITMRQLTHAESVEDPDDRAARRPATEWLLDLAARAEVDPRKSWAARAEVFRVENDQVRELLDLPGRKSLRYTLVEFAGDTAAGRPRREVLEESAKRADKVESGKRNLVQKKTLELYNHLLLADAIVAGAAPAVLPPADADGVWRKLFDITRPAEMEAVAKYRRFLVDGLGEDLEATLKAMPAAEQEKFRRAAVEFRAQTRAELVSAALAAEPAAQKWQAVLAAYRAKDQGKFDAAVEAFAAEQGDAASPRARTQARAESRLNAVAPFFHVTAGCGLVLAMLAVTWALLFVSPPGSEAVRRVAVWTLVGLFVVQTVALVLRMYLSDRPLVFVTNLYSSAVFIAWGALGIGLLVERVYPIGVGAFVAAAWGFCGNVIAHNLADAGEDTIQMQEAVLDSTFWLSTHVTTVTAGYAATFVAGFIGLVYIVLDLTSNVLTKPTVMGRGAGARKMEVGRAVGMLMYGVVCFATLLSLVGTVLGGIWADQSWGRFWGWDPKENGAILIVVWNALILHARWAGLVKDRGIAALAVVGSMVTTWSWFGTNQLGVGLHAYGFSKTLATGCVTVWLSHAAIVASAVGMWTFERFAGPKKA